MKALVLLLLRYSLWQLVLSSLATCVLAQALSSPMTSRKIEDVPPKMHDTIELVELCLDGQTYYFQIYDAEEIQKLIDQGATYGPCVIPANLSKQWDKTFGGSSIDQLTSAVTTFDGGYLLAGWSESDVSGDKSEARKGERDYWIVKIDAEGNKQWDKTLGGNHEIDREIMDDLLSSAISTPDSGYLLAGYAWSDASGDKSENSKGFEDFWIVKIDAEGNKQWDKTFGGDYTDILRSAISTPDGGYLLAGWSHSGASGDKSEDRKGVYSYWVIKIDSEGNKQWDKTFGGNKGNFLSSVISTPDGGYLLTGISNSPASEDKSEDPKGGCNEFGACDYDYWIIKIDEKGNKQWDKTLGSSDIDFPSSVTSTPDGGYLLAGSFLVKIDEYGNTQWENSISAEVVINSPDGGYLLAGTFDGDYGIIKIDDEGNSQWDKTWGGSQSDQLTELISTHNGGYLLAGISDSPASGDKSEESKGGNDFWIVKVAETQEASFSIQSLALVDTETDEELQTLQDRDTIDLTHLSTAKLSIVAHTAPETKGSVAFRLQGPFIHRHTENNAPYALFGDKPKGDFAGRLFPPGDYTVTATPYAEKNKAGTIGEPLTIHFTVINSDKIEDSQVTALDLYDAVTDEKIMELTEGAVIHTDELAHEELTVLMHTVPDFVGSVKVELWGTLCLTRIENTKPYALFRNNSKDLFGQALPAGDYHLRATPYTEANAQGVTGMALEVNFTVHADESSSVRLAVYPVPTSGVVHVNYESTEEEVQLMLLDFSGQPLRSLHLQGEMQLDLSAYRKGIYYLKVVDQQGVQIQRLILE